MTDIREALMSADEQVPDDLIPILEAKEIAGVSRVTVENWIRSESLTKYVRHPNRVYVSRGELLALLTPRKVVPSED